ncbi:hypothetical protein L4X63_21620 [Geomonas sp. Red32]|uniref:hypothetical protein n=1 Tax=Geomonas sp. Red32 TaxID=2912856 RepID=UPI00202CB1A6|nr:hypothetical protein [Geomonas sp. Red32]MCM0084186.1 hypothetical protein [Geomonas sp. Red32]
MEMNEVAANGSDPKSVIATLLSLGEIDTLFRDLYLDRARELLSRAMTPERYRGLFRMENELNLLPNRIENAMMQGNWSSVQEMSRELQTMKQEVESDAPLLALAKSVYRENWFPLDPFSQGMAALAGRALKELPALRERGMADLETLAKNDPECRDFYFERRLAFAEESSTAVIRPASVFKAAASPELLRQEAHEALEKGNFDKLTELAGSLSGGGTSTGAAAGGGETGKVRSEAYRYDFPAQVLRRAQELGFARFHVESHTQQYLKLLPHIWSPTFAGEESEQGRALRLSSLPLPADVPQALRSRVELFVLHPLVNSCGIRYLPCIAEEDGLVEDFEEPAAGSTLPVTPLLEALGLKRRDSLTRQQIEAVLAERGGTCVKDLLGLDPARFRLVCIPSDLHTRIGRERGWGSQEIWTHFDGYMLGSDGKLRALAGGDVRFGGIYDMVCIGPNYESDRIILRLAVVQRRRFERLQIEG